MLKSDRPSFSLPVIPPSGAAKHSQSENAPHTVCCQQPPPEAFWQRTTTDPVAAFTLVLAVATIGLLWATFMLWRATRKAISDASDAHISTNRAFVFFDGYEADLRSHELSVRGLWFSPRWRNSGSTPTKGMTYAVNWTTHDGDLPENFLYSYRVAPAPIFIGAKTAVLTEPFEVSAPIERHTGFEKPLIPSIFLWGRATYQDVFRDGVVHCVTWCYRVRFYSLDGINLSMGLFPWGPHNRTEEYEE